MRTILARGVLALGTVWVALDTGATKAGTPLPDWCTSTGALDAVALPATLPAVDGCDLTGRLVRYGDIGVIVPGRGSSVAYEGLLVNGVVEFEVEHAATGIVKMKRSTFLEDTAGKAKRLMQPENPDPCAPEAASGYAYKGHKAYSSLAWRYNAADEPASVAGAALSRIIAAANTITNGFNDCGITDFPDTPGHVYAGTTTWRPAPGVICGGRDGTSVVGWWNDKPTAKATACTYETATRLTEADIAFNPVVEWTVDTTLCIPRRHDTHDLQSTATHEWGHVFGLAHVPVDGPTATQTMAPTSTECDHGRRTLGIGDVNGLLKLYGRS